MQDLSELVDTIIPDSIKALCLAVLSTDSTTGTKFTTYSFQSIEDVELTNGNFEQLDFSKTVSETQVQPEIGEIYTLNTSS